MYIIGVSAYYHDSSACLFKNGDLLFACEEEKFTKIKHDNSFPINVINYIFDKYNLQKNDIECVCYYEDINLKIKRVKKNIKPQLLKNLKYSVDSYINVKKTKKNLLKQLSQISDKIFFSTHHESHIYYSFYTSKFENAICLSIDGVGEFDTVGYGIATKNGIEYHKLSEYPHSLGLFYGAMTSFLGFKPNEGEYKVMGLASYGNPETYSDLIQFLIRYYDHKLHCNMDCFCWDRSDKIMFTEKLAELLDLAPRMPEDPIEQCHKDLAAAVQKKYEQIFFKIINEILIQNKNTNLCLSGGCAYNGVANGKIYENTRFKHVWIPSAPSDAGSSIGACIHYLVKNNLLKERVTQNPFLGSIYEQDIRYLLKKLTFYECETKSELVRFAANQLYKGKIIGWFQGHCEFGARALGNRSIFADPTIESMKDRINNVVKKRENFRPFAPMVIKEKQNLYFEINDDIPYMNQVVKVKSEYIDKLLAVTHVDGTARVQTVYPHTLMHDLLLEFEKLSGYPILLNTSFNVKNMPIILRPEDAIEMFFNSDMDLLVLNNYIIFKKYDKNSI